MKHTSNYQKVIEIEVDAWPPIIFYMYIVFMGLFGKESFELSCRN